MGVFGTAPQTPPWSSSTKNWSLWSTPLGALTTSPFFLKLGAWSWNHLAKKRGVELKNVEQSSPKHPLYIHIYSSCLSSNIYPAHRDIAIIFCSPSFFLASSLRLIPDKKHSMVLLLFSIVWPYTREWSSATSTAAHYSGGSRGVYTGGIGSPTLQPERTSHSNLDIANRSNRLREIRGIIKEKEPLEWQYS